MFLEQNHNDAAADQAPSRENYAAPAPLFFFNTVIQNRRNIPFGTAPAPAIKMTRLLAAQALGRAKLVLISYVVK
jgi:hypothetical protein